jgi:perosamine synthetase
MVAEMAGVKHATAVSNGTVALHLALLAIGVGPGDTVIVPNLTYIAPANAVLYCGASVRLVDVDPGTWNIAEQEIRRAMDETVKAVITTDLYGLPCYLSPTLRDDLTSSRVIVVEDAAEAIGSSHASFPAGSLGDIGTLSFFGNKTITTGEGGMVLTSTDSYDFLIRRLKNQGVNGSRRYFHDMLGYNYRMTNIQAAIGVAQMERLTEIIERKKQIEQWYRDRLADSVQFQVVPEEASTNAWLVSVVLPDEIDRDTVTSLLAKEGIETRPVFVPISEMPYMPHGHTPIANWIGSKGISLPSYPELTHEDVRSISVELLRALEKT